MKYHEPDEYLIVNIGDRDLVPIRIKIPTCPPIETIDGYGKPLKQQKWERKPLPHRLSELNKNDKLTIQEKTKFLEDRQEDYKDEIKYIIQEWDRRINGYWFFINGKPTWITGKHYFYLNHWRIDVGYPEYRNRDRKFFVFEWFCWNDPNCFGFNYPKHRREGATYKVQCCMYEVISRERSIHGGIQSMTEPSAKDVFQKKLIPSWRKLPFFYKPVFEGSTNPKKSLEFFAPAMRVTRDSIDLFSDDALDSWIDFGSSDKGCYDGTKLRYYHSDEVGKMVEEDAYERHQIVKECCSLGQGKKIVGMIVNTSTVGEVEKGGGEAFKRICRDSHYSNNGLIDIPGRNKNGQTISGLYNLFIPAYDGLEGFIDEFGNSMIEEAKQHLLNTRETYRETGDFEALSEIIRLHPMTYRECFRGSSKLCNFNKRILEERLDDFMFGNKFTTRGNFKWENDEQDNKVIWCPDPENGKFTVSYLPDNPNKYEIDGGFRIPGNPTSFIAGGDPFKFKTTKWGRKSNGAGAVFRLRDVNIDDEGKNIKEFKTNRFCCTYSFRPPTKQEYGEDMLMMCIYYGCYMFPEINYPFLWEYFEERGYKGYLLYSVDRKTGRLSLTPGSNTGDATRDQIFREFHTYIERYGSNEVHDEILRQCLEIEDEMTDYDLFVACGYCFLGMKNLTYIQEDKGGNIDGWFRQFSYQN